MKSHDRNEESALNGLDYLELWISLARREWRSLVVIPAGREGSTAEIASNLSKVGQRLSFGPVTAITLSALEYGSALALADLQQHVKRSGSVDPPTVSVQSKPSGPPPGGASASANPRAAHFSPRDDATEAKAENGEVSSPHQTLMVAPAARLIISVPPVVTVPLGLAPAEEADALVLAIWLNRTRVSEVKRTVHLVGRERITGCLLLR